MSLLINKQTGEFVELDENGQNKKLDLQLRAKRFYYLHCYREYSCNRSVMLCHVTPSVNRNVKSSFSAPETKKGEKPRSSQALDNKFYTELSKKHLPGYAPEFAPTASGVYVFKGHETKKAHFHGVLKCSNVWACPVCSSRIATKRGLELKQATEQHKKNGGYLYLVTLTIPHERTSKLDVLLDDLTDSYRKTTSGRAYQAIKKDYGIIGSIRALEVTYGDSNGWHPHLHILVLTEKSIDLKEFKLSLFDRWHKITVKKGYKPIFTKHLVDVQSGEYAAMYIAKVSDNNSHWHISDEMTKSHKKLGKIGRFSAHALLVSFIDTKNYYHLNLFKDYERIFKGKNQLVWSRGLKKLFKIEEKTDDQINNEFDEISSHLATIPTKIWKLIACNNLFTEVLEMAENGSNMLQSYLATLEIKDRNKKLDIAFSTLQEKADFGRVQSISPYFIFKPLEVVENLNIFAPGWAERIQKNRILLKDKKNRELKINKIKGN